MNEQNTNTHEGLAAPPPLLIYGLLVLLLLIVIAVIGAVDYSSSGRLGSVIRYIMLGGGLIVVSTILAPILFRRRFARWFLPVVILFWALVGIAGTAGGILVYQNVLPPRYQNELLTPLPFMRAFMPATPSGGLVPTVAVEDSQLSAEDLLGLTLGGTPTAPSTRQPIEATPSAETTLEASSNLNSNGTTNSGIAVAMAAGDSTDTPQPTLTPTPIPPTATLPLPTQTPPPDAVQSTPLPPTVVPTSAPANPSSAHIFGMTWILQGWNDCGPANITQVLTLYGWQEPQEYAADYLKPSAEDKNVTPQEMVAFVNDETGVRAITRVGGDMTLLKTLLANNFPVIVETGGPFFEGYDWVGHYQTLVGYDDSAGGFFVYDTYLGPGTNGAGLLETYTDFDYHWSSFNRVFIVVYDREREGLLQSLLGNRAAPLDAVQYALDTAIEETRTNPRNMYAWFNIGSSLTRQGNYDAAARAYDRARALGVPFRMMWYQFGPFEAYFNVGRYDDVMTLVNTNLTNGAQYVEETYYWQGRVLEAQGDRQGAVDAYQRALLHNERYQIARDALTALGTS
ncbi:MAG: C39 family peptidase [Anaerolineae bacterium]